MATVHEVRSHYDRLSVFYRALWGEHIHHGYFENGERSALAQVKLIERLARRARIAPGARVLDVGCGLGGSAFWLARKLGCSVLGLTLSPVQAAIASAQARTRRLHHLASFEVRDANRLDLKPESFDAVWVIEASEHLRDKRRFIEECAGVLRPGGALALCAWLAADRPTVEQERLVGEVCRGMLCPSLASMGDYAAWMVRAGLDEIRTEDITRKVARTWDRCAAIVRRREVAALVGLADRTTREFIRSFESMRRAYAVGAMAYGMITASKVSGAGLKPGAA